MGGSSMRNVSQEIRNLLAERPDLTLAEICEALSLDRGGAAARLSAMQRGGLVLAFGMRTKRRYRCLRQSPRRARVGAATRRGALDAERAAEIRRRARGGESYSTLAAEFGVSKAMVGLIRNGKAWCSSHG